MRGRVIDELGEQHRPAGGQWAARPPQVQGRRVAVADGLLPGGLAVDVFERDAHLDQLRLVPELACRSYRVPSPCPFLGPVADDAGGGEVAEVDVTERIDDIADHVAFGTVRVD